MSRFDFGAVPSDCQRNAGVCRSDQSNLRPITGHYPGLFSVPSLTSASSGETRSSGDCLSVVSSILGPDWSSQIT